MNATRRDFLVLWKWKEALAVEGEVMTGAVGSHAGGLKRGDRMFVWATTGNELFLLGAIEVMRSGKRRADGRSVYGPFQIIPLKGLKWRLRFQASAERLSRKGQLAMQVRARRRPTPETTKLLEQILSAKLRVQKDIRVSEGKTKVVTLTQRERSKDLRILALSERGTRCEICEFDFEKVYGEFAKNCVEVHHLALLARAGKRGVRNTLEDVLVVCPNCHRALHQFRNPGDWKAFRKACHLN
jgi:hypothetical protein